MGPEGDTYLAEPRLPLVMLLLVWSPLSFRPGLPLPPIFGPIAFAIAFILRFSSKMQKARKPFGSRASRWRFRAPVKNPVLLQNSDYHKQ